MRILTCHSWAGIYDNKTPKINASIIAKGRFKMLRHAADVLDELPPKGLLSPDEVVAAAPVVEALEETRADVVDVRVVVNDDFVEAGVEVLVVVPV